MWHIFTFFGNFISPLRIQTATKYLQMGNFLFSPPHMRTKVCKKNWRTEDLQIFRQRNFRYVVEVMKGVNLKFSLNQVKKRFLWISFCLQGSATDTLYFDFTTLKKDYRPTITSIQRYSNQLILGTIEAAIENFVSRPPPLSTFVLFIWIKAQLQSVIDAW